MYGFTLNTVIDLLAIKNFDFNFLIKARIEIADAIIIAQIFIKYYYD